jgi:low molecular weight protein-tyrosine phosphatase
VTKIAGLVAAARSHAGRIVRSVRRRSDHLLSPRRLRRASIHVRSLAAPSRILVICYGNVCRSPYLAAILARRLPQARILSAGFIGPGRSVPEHSLLVAGRRGIDLCQHRSQLVSATIVRSADLVVVMDRRQAKMIVSRFGIAPERVVQAGDLDPQFSGGRTIVDPWGKSLEIFEECFDRLDRCADQLVRLLVNGD